MSIRLLQLPFISLTAQIVTIENYWSLPACPIWSFQPRPHLIFFNSLMIVDPPTTIAAQVQIAVTSSRSRTMIEVPLAIRSNPLNTIMKVSMASLPRLETPMSPSQNTLTPSLPVPEEFFFCIRSRARDATRGIPIRIPTPWQALRAQYKKGGM